MLPGAIQKATALGIIANADPTQGTEGFDVDQIQEAQLREYSKLSTAIFSPATSNNKNMLTHYNAAGEAAMVDVSAKAATHRTATAHAFVRMSSHVLAALPANKKGDPLQVARIAGIMAAKKTSDLIPLCHQLPLTHVSIEFVMEESGVRITATAATTAQTGVEMEALIAASIAALTIYDMTKALDKAIEIREIYLLEKTGGKSGDFRRQDA
jgi:cyclic pyranopterin phosphate synthase